MHLIPLLGQRDSPQGRRSPEKEEVPWYHLLIPAPGMWEAFLHGGSRTDDLERATSPLSFYEVFGI